MPPVFGTILAPTRDYVPLRTAWRATARTTAPRARQDGARAGPDGPKPASWLCYVQFFCAGG